MLAANDHLGADEAHARLGVPIEMIGGFPIAVIDGTARVNVD
jgi:hypothetical protein